MKVYKFGGASVSNAAAVKNLFSIVQEEKENLLIVISAMGKTTNNLEKLLDLAFNNQDYSEQLKAIINFHQEIINALFDTPLEEINELFDLLAQQAEESPRYSYDFSYDQLVSLGEIISTRIVSAYLIHQGLNCAWVDARKYIRTNSNWREAEVNWDFTKTMVNRFVKPLFEEYQFAITQGFIGSDTDGHTTTLGREGSDFTGAIFANCLDAGSLTVWKDVDGILNKDPKLYDNFEQFDKLSYKEIIEMSYYGATVIHPKTIKPLADKHISLYVRSFLDCSKNGTVIGEDNSEKQLSSYIIKENQVLITFSNKDLSFTNEESIGSVLHVLKLENLKTNLIQSSATTFSVCCNYNEQKLKNVIHNLSESFDIHYNLNLTLITIKNYQPEDLKIELFKDKNILLEQKTRKNVRILLNSDILSF